VVFTPARQECCGDIYAASASVHHRPRGTRIPFTAREARTPSDILAWSNHHESTQCVVARTRHRRPDLRWRLLRAGQYRPDAAAPTEHHAADTAAHAANATAVAGQHAVGAGSRADTTTRRDRAQRAACRAA